MHMPDVEGAIQYALNRLERELLPVYVYHSVVHTRDDVAPAAERLAALSGVQGEDLMLLRTAAYYHDLGYVEQRAAHEAVAVQIITLVLPNFGYAPDQIEMIGMTIMATRLPQTPRNVLGELLADADLDVLGRTDFMACNQTLRAEMAAFGMEYTDEQWYSQQLRFLQTHRYWTPAARSLREAQKQRNCDELVQLIAQC